MLVGSVEPRNRVISSMTSNPSYLVGLQLRSRVLINPIGTNGGLPLAARKEFNSVATPPIAVLTRQNNTPIRAS